jgi:hypothetical protein
MLELTRFDVLLEYLCIDGHQIARQSRPENEFWYSMRTHVTHCVPVSRWQ